MASTTNSGRAITARWAEQIQQLFDVVQTSLGHVEREQRSPLEASPACGPVVPAASLEKPKPSKCRSFVASLRTPL